MQYSFKNMDYADQAFQISASFSVKFLLQKSLSQTFGVVVVRPTLLLTDTVNKKKKRTFTFIRAVTQYSALDWEERES